MSESEPTDEVSRKYTYCQKPEILRSGEGHSGYLFTGYAAVVIKVA